MSRHAADSRGSLKRNSVTTSKRHSPRSQPRSYACARALRTVDKAEQWRKVKDLEHYRGRGASDRNASLPRVRRARRGGVRDPHKGVH